MTDAHKAFRQDMEEKTPDEFMGIKGQGLFSISIFAISITQGDLAVSDVEDAVIGQSHAVGVAAEVIEHGLWGAERLFGVDDPALLACGFGLAGGRRDFSFSQACCNRARNFPRNTWLRALTGNRKLGRASIQRL